MQKARFLFFSEGFSGLGMETVADRLSVSKATLYKYFPNKRSLVAAVVDGQMAAIAGCLDGLEDPAVEFPERFASFLDMVFDLLGPAMKRFIPDILRDAPWEWERIVKFRKERVFVFLTTLLRQGAGRGLLREDIRSEAMAPMLVAMIEQFGRPEVLAGLPLTAEEAVRSFAGILFQGILSESGRREFERIETDISERHRPSSGEKGTASA